MMVEILEIVRVVNLIRLCAQENSPVEAIPSIPDIRNALFN